MPRFACPVATPPTKKVVSLQAGATAPRRAGPQRGPLWHAIQLKAAQAAAPAAEARNGSGLPTPLRAGLEALSGVAMGDVRVHRNSAEPARLGALAYAQDSDIHLGPGQGGHLPHEAWHVVQQKQGRVAQTRQTERGVPLNDDAGLEREADIMGAKAVQAGATNAGEGAPAAPETVTTMPVRSASRAPVQRYRIVGKYHVSNDGTAAVMDVKNNKDLYATDARIDEANAALAGRVANIRFVSGGPGVRYGDRELSKANPVIDVASVARNDLDAGVAPAADARQSSKTGVQLPAECEKGAIAIIGAYIQDQKVPANAFAYQRKDHSQARIANLIAQSQAGGGQKATWFDDWVRLEGLVAKAAKCYNKVAANQPFAANSGIDAVRAEVRLTHASVADRDFDATFALNPGGYETRTTRLAAGAVIENMIRVLDAKINIIEHDVMSSADPTYQGYQQDVLRAKDVRAQLIQLYAANDFPKAVVEAALDLAGQRASLEKYFAAKPADPLNYANNLNYASAYRMRSFLEELVATIGVEIVRLEARRNARFGAGATRNEAVDPAVGQAYGIIGGHFNFKTGGRWNWHWASVVLKTATDNVTMEAHASHKEGDESHNENWDFKMYGRPLAEGSADKTFHDIWRGQGFGQAPVTVLGEASVAAEPRIQQFHLAGLTLVQVALYRFGANDLRQIMLPLTDKAKDKDEIIDYYDRHIDRVLRITTGELPRQFVEERLHPGLNRQYEDVASLKKPDVGLLERFTLEADVADAAVDMRSRLASLNEALNAYEYSGKKTGALV